MRTKRIVVLAMLIVVALTCGAWAGILGEVGKAIDEIKIKAEQGDANAQFNMGALYQNIRAYEDALKWYRMAAEQGHAKAQYNLGQYYNMGNGVPQNHREAVKWFQKAAETGLAEAQFALGTMYFDGKGVLQDYREAENWFLLAAYQEHGDSQFNLGILYDLDKNYVTAAKWLMKAADKGYDKAQLFLGIKYCKGEGVPQDNVLGYKWLNLAGAAGNDKAIEARNLLSAIMTKTELEEGQKLAREWKPTK